MKEAVVKKKIAELSEVITLSHVGKIAKAVGDDGVYLPDSPAGSAASIEDSLEVLGLHLKYLLFDLEATRRENRYLRQLLESRRPPKADGGEEGPF